MDDKILEILRELKEDQTRLELGQQDTNKRFTNIEADIKKLDIKMDNMHDEIKKQIFDFEKATE